MRLFCTYEYILYVCECVRSALTETELNSKRTKPNNNNIICIDTRYAILTVWNNTTRKYKAHWFGWILYIFIYIFHTHKRLWLRFVYIYACAYASHKNALFRVLVFDICSLLIITMIIYWYLYSTSDCYCAGGGYDCSLCACIRALLLLFICGTRVLHSNASCVCVHVCVCGVVQSSYEKMMIIITIDRTLAATPNCFLLRRFDSIL